MKRILLALLLCIPCVAFAQNAIFGVVVDSLTKEPLPYATVYVNGTTKGTVTDADGNFELRNVSFPLTVVFSFIGYQPKAVDFDRKPGGLLIELRTNNELPEVVIDEDETEWRVNMANFKKFFLGDDWLGRNAQIRNEDVLMFERQEQSFTATAREPLVIDLPLLGYELDVDLVGFSLLQSGGKYQCSILGYFYYKPYDEEEKYESNRKTAYYNSGKQFLSALYGNRLAENGFVVYDAESRTPVDLSLEIEKAGDNLMLVRGLKDRRFIIRYYHKLNGAPFDRKNHGGLFVPYNRSGIIFMEDTCAFTGEGIVPDASISFFGKMSEKRVAACLPADYDVAKDATR